MGNAFLLDVGRRIAEARRAKGYSQEQLAGEISISIQSVSSIELGKKSARLENLLNICKALDVSADYLLTGVKSAEQLTGIQQKLAILSPADYAMVESLIDHLNNRS